MAGKFAFVRHNVPLPFWVKISLWRYGLKINIVSLLHIMNNTKEGDGVMKTRWISVVLTIALYCRM